MREREREEEEKEERELELGLSFVTSVSVTVLHAQVDKHLSIASYNAELNGGRRGLWFIRLYDHLRRHGCSSRPQRPGKRQKHPLSVSTPMEAVSVTSRIVRR